MLDSIKTELDSNEFLLADFLEVCFPIQALDGISNRANDQHYKGKRTQIGWSAKEVVPPTVDGSSASGANIKVAGLTGCIRGMKFKRPVGRTVRLSLIVLDDPKRTRALDRCRNARIASAVLGLAGPGRKISSIMPCTVIRPSDIAENIKNPVKNAWMRNDLTSELCRFQTSDARPYCCIRCNGLKPFIAKFCGNHTE